MFFAGALAVRAGALFVATVLGAFNLGSLGATVVLVITASMFLTSTVRAMNFKVRADEAKIELAYK